MPRRPKRNPKPANPWLTARRITQAVSLGLFLVLFLAISQWGLRQPASAMPFLLDPLAIISFWLSGHIWLPLSLLAVLTLLLTIFFGRAWCGWICPLGMLFDVFPSKKNPVFSSSHEHYRKVKHLLLIATLTLAVFGSLLLLILDPLALVFRSLTTVIWPLLDKIITALETSLYALAPFQGLVNGFESDIRPLLFSSGVTSYRFPLVFGIILIGIFLLNAISERFWCRYLCPLGSGLGLISKLALVRRQVDAECTKCGLCAGHCPTGTIDPQQGYQSDPAECTVCMRCMNDCGRHATHFGFTPKPAGMRAYDPDRRDVLRTAGLSAAALFFLNLEDQVSPDREKADRLLPPGADRNGILSKCIRCSECMRVCPTGGLQPSLRESGLLGLWTPVLVPRLGNCSYACNACGQVCPTRAIPPLDMQNKRLAVIGCAAIDTSRCLAWGERQACIVCQEMCPLPEKAIILLSGISRDGRELLLPSVVPELCIGCGTCENKCPVAGPAAIRVYTSQQTL